MSKNNSIDKMVEQFTSKEELQAYADSQYKTIINLNTKINELSKAVEAERAKANAALQELATIKAATPKESLGQFSVSDEESICLIQIAMLKNHALGRELITDEVKRLEVFVKTLAVIRGKDVLPKSPGQKQVENSKTEDLFKQLEELNKTEPQ